ncbi:MAG: hypothetical protein IT327_21490 [Anaerolineae bacterium]|nr:hypothetical protein [Anaerolineae bacterium]
MTHEAILPDRSSSCLKKLIGNVCPTPTITPAGGGNLAPSPSQGEGWGEGVYLIKKRKSQQQLHIANVPRWCILERITEQLQNKGVTQFADAFNKLIGSIRGAREQGKTKQPQAEV